MQSYSGVDNLDIMTVAVKYNRFQLERLLKYCTKDAVILDFGAGTGTFVRMLRSRGYEAGFVETDPELHAKLCAQDFTGFKSLDDIEDGSIDLIYSLNVLEHIEDDGATLRSLHLKLKKGGTVYLLLPALNWLYSSMDRKVGHHRRYTFNGLKPKVEQAGFQVVQWGYVDFLGIMATLFYKLFGSRSGDIDTGTIAFYDTFLFPVSRFLDRFFSRLAGKNLEVALQK